MNYPTFALDLSTRPCAQLASDRLGKSENNRKPSCNSHRRFELAFRSQYWSILPKRYITIDSTTNNIYIYIESLDLEGFLIQHKTEYTGTYRY
jgi:hypothetical protein